jgi:hypothetical protein
MAVSLRYENKMASLSPALGIDKDKELSFPPYPSTGERGDGAR